MRKKLRSQRGETIAEALIAVAIMALAFVILCGAVGAAANINHKASLKRASFRSDVEPTAVLDQTVTVTTTIGPESRTESETVTVYERNGYYYYE